jgi:putative PIN family toxin of toxin-antitoxin system
MIKVVLDTNILVSALLKSKSLPAEVWRLCQEHYLCPYYSEDVFEEYQEVLIRPKFNFSLPVVSAIFSFIQKDGFLVSAENSNIFFQDESDRKFYDIAKANDAILITGNLKHYPDENFIMSAKDFLGSIDSGHYPP